MAKSLQVQTKVLFKAGRREEEEGEEGEQLWLLKLPSKNLKKMQNREDKPEINQDNHN